MRVLGRRLDLQPGNGGVGMGTIGDVVLKLRTAGKCTFRNKAYPAFLQQLDLAGFPVFEPR